MGTNNIPKGEKVMLKKFIMVLVFVGMSALATGCVVETTTSVDCVEQVDCPLDSYCDAFGDCIEGCIVDENCDWENGEICDIDGVCAILL